MTGASPLVASGNYSSSSLKLGTLRSTRSILLVTAEGELGCQKLLWTGTTQVFWARDAAGAVPLGVGRRRGLFVPPRDAQTRGAKSASGRPGEPSCLSAGSRGGRWPGVDGLLPGEAGGAGRRPSLPEGALRAGRGGGGGGHRRPLRSRSRGRAHLAPAAPPACRAAD